MQKQFIMLVFFLIALQGEGFAIERDFISLKSMAPKVALETIKKELDYSVSLESIQPSEDLIRQIEQRPSEGDSGVKQARDFSDEQLPYRPGSILLKDKIPYYRHSSLKKGAKYVLHPMRMGAFLLRNARGTLASELVKSVQKVAYELPNGGLAWYYPRYYRVARMMGGGLKFSSISQGTLIAGLVGMARENKEIDLTLARKAFLAMNWPFEKGGINLADSAVLEMPSFSGPPEIILNGWIDALLHIRDYATVSGDQDAWKLFRKNIEFMADILPNFDAPQNNISRYSDMSPYRVKVTLSNPADVDTLRVLYRPKHEILDPILVTLERTKDPKNYSPYENQIFRQSGKSAFVWLSCSQLYETVLLADTDMMSLELNTGKVDRMQSTPNSAGKSLHFTGFQLDADIRYVSLDTNDGLICGYPTNFAVKGKENYYHSYHVVGLMLLAFGEGVEGERQKQTLLRWAIKWYDDVSNIIREEGLQFHDFQDLLRRTNKNQVIVSHLNFEELLAKTKDYLTLTTNIDR